LDKSGLSIHGLQQHKNHLPASEAQLARVHLLAAAEPQAPQRCFAVLGQRQGFEGLQEFSPGEASGWFKQSHGKSSGKSPGPIKTVVKSIEIQLLGEIRGKN